ncbi:proton-translocating transhydrogenase family protein, partial [Pseudomonas sp. SIMBA_041]|uniref:proton-translocating transhydrogenase family protein n=1 Tax=Pseudomonas sp. SIMBA_041 TaxID=3085782 RepID=UPI00397D0333
SIVIVGAMLQTVTIDGSMFTPTSLLGAFAVFLASINIFGGFAVTERMLAMFKPKVKKAPVATTDVVPTCEVIVVDPGLSSCQPKHLCR